MSLMYWVIQFIGWILYGLFALLMIGTFDGTDQFYESIFPVSVYVLLMLCGSHLMNVVIRKWNWMYLGRYEVFGRFLTATLLVSITIQLLHMLITSNQMSFSDFTEYSGYTWINFHIWFACYALFWFSKNRKASEIERIKLERALHEAELTILKNQINPHFLFNVLNNIRSLVRVDQEKARSMITSISDLLRYVLHFSQSEKVLLLEEMQIVEDYLRLESIQFGDRMRVEIEVSEPTKSMKIPPMTVQLLVENAVKHGLSKQDEGGVIRIETLEEDNELIIKVVNTGKIEEQEEQAGLGLTNLFQRMSVLFNDSFSFTLKSSSLNTVTATIKVAQNT